MIIARALSGGNSEKFREHGLVEADDEVFAVHNDDRYAELAAFFHHFSAFSDIRADVIVRIIHAVFSKKFFGHVAEVARRGRIDFNFSCPLKL